MIKEQIWVFKQCFKAKPLVVIFIVLLYLILYLLQPLELLVIKKIIYIISNILYTDYNIKILIFAFFIFISLNNIQFSLSMTFIEIVENKIIDNLQYLLFKAVSETNLLNLDNDDYLTKLQRARKTCWYNLTNIFNNNMHFLGGIISTSFTLFMVYQISPFFACAYILIALIQNLYKSKYSSENYNLSYSLEYESRKLSYFFNLIVDKDSTKEIRCYNISNWLIDKWKNYFSKIESSNLCFSLKWSKINFVFEVISNILDKVMMIFSVYIIRVNLLDISNFTMLIQSRNIIIRGIGNIFDRFISIYKESNYISELKEIIDNKNSTSTKYKVIYNNKTEYSLAFENIQFQYGKSFCLKDLNFSLKKGEILALVGENGCGKSTLAKLALGLLIPSQGILYRENDNASAAFQDFACFNFSIRDNIGFGDIQYLNNDEAILSAMENGMSIDLINKSSKGLNTILGRSFDNDGIELSGGEWQRLAITRALFKKNCLVIFDEPSAALDPLAELKQFENIKKSIKGYSIIIISHRIGITRMADKIAYMDNGKIIEYGTHKDLMDYESKYKCFFLAQSKWYDKETYI